MRPYYGAIDRDIEEFERAGLYIEDKGNIEYYLGVNIEDQDNDNIKLTQPHIIDSIINDVHLPNNTASRQTPALSTRILRSNTTSPMFDERFKCISVLGNTNF